MIHAIFLIIFVSCYVEEGLTRNIQLGAMPVPTTKVVNPSVVPNAFQANITVQNPITCSCGVFLSGQFMLGSSQPPIGYPSITAELDEPLPCNSAGVAQCRNKCLDNLVKHLNKSTEIICASIDRDCFKERAYLFIKTCNGPWTNTNLAAGKEYCCKNGEYYKCPPV